MFFPLSVAQTCDMTMCCTFCIFHAHLQFSCYCIVSMTPYRDMLYKYITECVFDCIWGYVFKWILQLKKNHQQKFNTFIQFSSTFLCRMTIRNYNPQPCKLSGFNILHVHCRFLVWRVFFETSLSQFVWEMENEKGVQSHLLLQQKEKIQFWIRQLVEEGIICLDGEKDVLLSLQSMAEKWQNSKISSKVEQRGNKMKLDAVCTWVWT